MYTQGPWTIGTRQVERGIIRYTIGAVGKYPHTETNTLDDARLIAAVPDLLAALVAMLGQARPFDDLELAAADMARAAIAKATEG